MYAITAISRDVTERKQYQAALEQLIADLEDVLDDARKTLQVKIEASDAEISAESLPRVEADEEQVQQVFQNLLANAIGFSGEEQPRVHLSAEQNVTEWLVSVTDEGIGIDPDNQKYDFEVFKGLQGSEGYTGTEISLAICERSIERHDGGMWVESELGEGATFSFTLPAV